MTDTLTVEAGGFKITQDWGIPQCNKCGRYIDEAAAEEGENDGNGKP